MAGTGERAPWLVAWSLIVLMLSLIVYYVVIRHPAQTRPDMANTGAPPAAAAAPNRAGAPPDISQMTPRERFLRLSDRVMGAAANGDSATARRFLPMARAAYGMLDSADTDLRYHAATLALEDGDTTAALALADTILARAPHHLFGFLIRISVADTRHDAAALTRSRADFLAQYASQMALRLTEYDEHRDMLAEVKRRMDAGQ
jgi:hypothetical protein